MTKTKNKQSKQNNKNNKDKLNKNNKKKQKKRYKVRNWSEYNESLKQRGSLIVWIDECVANKWYAKPTHKQGSQPIYSDLAIQLTLQFGKVFKQKLRQTEGLVVSLFKLMNINKNVPNYSTLSRRGGSIKVKLPKENKEKVVLIADSSGLKVYGEGEWKVRKHGWSKHRTWRKIHVGIDKDGEIRAINMTGNDIHDMDTVESLIEQEESSIESFIGDGAYDKKLVYDVCQDKKINKIIIPPQKNAIIWKHGNSSSPPYPRDENLRKIRKTSRKKWKEMSGYHVRSLVETAMFRFKTILSDRLNARNFNQQKTEVLISASVLNKMTKLGMPDSYAVS